MTPLIVHHANCPDGFGAAWWLARNLCEWDPAELHPAGYDDPPPERSSYTGRPVYIVDFCYPASVLDAIADAAERLVVVDHHQTAIGHAQASTLAFYTSLDEWEQREAEAIRVAVVDQNRSGVGLVADWVTRTSGTLPPAFLSNLEDRDLWRFELNDTADVFAAVTSWPYETGVWDWLATLEHDELVAQGAAINRYRDRLIEQVAASSFTLRLDEHDIPCASSPYAIGSDVAGRLAENSPDGIGAYVILHDADVQVGLRGRKGGIDVAELAERYGGGGHPAASGLRLSWADFTRSTQNRPD